ncbi:MAG: SLC13 family permease [Tidjanibacter sp.]|nr:SLC13 family permease [Tidjanibacter sp.]
MSSTLGALIGLALAIFLIIKKLSPAYSIIIGAVVGGLAGGLGLTATVDSMVSGVKDITPAILRILSAGILSGVLIKTGAAASISHTIVRRLGERRVYMALALSTMLLTAVGVFVDVAVITVAPIALMIGDKLELPKAKLLLAMIGGGKCGNIISPNPNTIIVAENFDASLPSVMFANVLPALLGIVVTVYLIVPLMRVPKNESTHRMTNEEIETEHLPSFWASIAGPLVAIALLALRPLFGIVVDPLIALPVGGLVDLLTTRNMKNATGCIAYGLDKMSVVAVLLVGTGTIAGIIKASDLTQNIIGLLSGWSAGGTLMAPLAGALMSAATASTTAGATIASASFSNSILGAGVTAVWGAAMVNSGATMLDHLPHGSFFHATGGSVGMDFKARMRLIPYETAIGTILATGSVVCYLIFN